MSELTAKRAPIIAMSLAVVAVVVVLIAVIVVVNRGSVPEPVVAAKPPVGAPKPPVDLRVAAEDVVKLDTDDALVVISGGVRIKDPALAKKLGLTTDDVITSISGRPITRQFDVHDVLFNVSMMKATTLYAEVADGHAIMRWQIDGDLRKARYSVRPTFGLNTGSAAMAGLAGTTIDPALLAVPDPLVDKIDRVDDTHVTVPKGTIAQTMTNPFKLTGSARVVPSVKNGAPDGFKLYAVRPSSVLAHLGFANGDTIHTVNGLSMDDSGKALQSYEKLKTAHELTFEITRRGHPLTLVITEK